MIVELRDYVYINFLIRYNNSSITIFLFIFNLFCWYLLLVSQEPRLLETTRLMWHHAIFLVF